MSQFKTRAWFLHYGSRSSYMPCVSCLLMRVPCMAAGVVMLDGTMVPKQVVK
jgi:hypothetical protein